MMKEGNRVCAALKSCRFSSLSVRAANCFSFVVVVTIIISLFVSVLARHGDYDYKDALSKGFLYLEAQRSGRLPYNQRVTWRGHSGLTDGLEQGVDLVGGYYDAGDHVKFGLPMAFTITMLSWSIIEYSDMIEKSGEMTHALEAIKWGTDYFIKTHTDPNVLWGEVGDGGTDHYCWQRSEDMTTSRQAYKVDAENPGSDISGETAAAMAAASMVFKTSNPHYSHLLLHHAQELFDFADKYRGKYDDSIKVVKNYYPSLSGYMDELLWAALWLHRATGNVEYLNYAINNAHSFGGTGWTMTEFSWDVKYAGVQILAAKVLMEGKHSEHAEILKLYRSKAEYYLCSCLQKNKEKNVHLTPAGLLFIRQWNNMQYVANAAFFLTIYSDYLRQFNETLSCSNQTVVVPDELMDFAKSQVDYILGSNPMNTSYLVGFGPKYPRFVHHRGASVVSYKQSPGFIGCTQGYDNWYGRREPNPNNLVGALVGGPDSKDMFNDRRSNYMQTEACTYNTVPLVGVLAKLNHQKDSRLLPDERTKQISSY